MAVIKLTQLGGLLPSASARALPDNGAQAADNLLARSAEFRPLSEDALRASSLAVTDPKTIYHPARKANGDLNLDMASGWRVDADVLSYARGQIDDNATERIYYTSTSGITPPRVRDAVGVDKLLGVPAPSVSPAVVANAVYSFTEDQKRIEKMQAQQKLVQLVETHASPSVVGLAGVLPAVGWIRRSDFDGSIAAEKSILRIFAVDPTTKAVVSTYSSMPVEESAWIFDPALGGEYSTKPPGLTLPAWAAGHTMWWVISLKAFARAYDVNEAALTAAVQTIDMPGTQGGQKYLTAPQATLLVERIAAKFDVASPAVKALSDTLYDRQRMVATLFERGGATSVKSATEAFYSRSDIAASIDSAKTAFAETIWRYAEMIGKATATPWYDQGGA